MLELSTNVVADRCRSVVAARDCAVVGAEVARDHHGVVADRYGIAVRDDLARFEAVHTVADAHDEGHVVLDDEPRSVEIDDAVEWITRDDLNAILAEDFIGEEV